MATVFKFDDLIKDSEVGRMLGVTTMTLWRWTNLREYEDLKFPPVVKLGQRNYRSRSALNAWCNWQAKKYRISRDQIIRETLSNEDRFLRDFIGDDRRTSGTMRKRR